MATNMNSRFVEGLSVLGVDNCLVMTEQKFQNAVIATNILPQNAQPTARDICLAFLAEFENQIAPSVINKFNSDVIIQFLDPEETNLVASYGKLQGNGFEMQLIPWGNLHGGNLVDWETRVTIDITGLPPHAFDQSALAPLIGPYCSIQTCGFHKAKGICRIDGYALSVASIPTSGHLAIQFPTSRGVRNIVFPTKMKTYIYSQAPSLGIDDSSLFINHSAPTDHSEIDPTEGYDSDVIREALEAKIQDERERNAIAAARSDTGSSWDSEGNHWRLNNDSDYSTD